MPDQPNYSKGAGRAALGVSFDAVQRTNHVLAIAINDYKHFPQLNNCVRDVDAFIDVVTDRYLFKKPNIRTLINEEATRDNIYRAFREICQVFKQKDKEQADNLIIYFSGHGEWDGDFRTRGYWIPQEARFNHYPDFIPNSDIRDFLEDINAHHIFVISDSCFSGSFFMDGQSRSAHTTNDKHRSRWGLAAGRLEVADGVVGTHSPFAIALINKLKNSYDSVSVSELCTSVMEALAKDYDRPIGEPLVIRGHESGQFYFHLDANEEKEWRLAQELNTFDAYLKFMKNFPGSEWGEAAREHLLVLEKANFWKEVSGKVIGHLNDYLELLPEGKFAEKAGKLLDDWEDELAWLMAQEKDSEHGYRTYLENKHKQEKDEKTEEATRKIKKIYTLETLDLEEVLTPAGPPRAEQPKGHFMWCLDNGHGKDTPGKRSPIFDLNNQTTQLFEYELNRDIVNRIRRALTKLEIAYFVVADEQEDISLAERVNRVNFLDSDLPKIFLSIHANSGPPLPSGWTGPAHQGIATFFARGSKTGRKIANIFQKKIVSATGWMDRKIKPGPFYTLRKTHCPAVHIENGFINHKKECLALLTDEVRQQIADAYVQAILEIEKDWEAYTRS